MPPSFYNLVGQVATAGWQWLLTIWLVRIFGVRELGIFSFILAVISPLLLFSNFQLRNRLAAQPSLLALVPTFLRLRLLTTVISSLVAFAWVMYAQSDVDTLLLIGVLAFKCAEASAELIHGVLQAENKLGVVAFAMSMKAVLAVGLMALVAVLGWKSGVFFLGLAAAYFIISVSVEWKNAHAVGESSAQSVWQVLKQDPHLFSLGAVAWLGSLNASWPRFLLQHHHGMDVLGEFTAIFAIYAVMGVVLNAWLQGMIGPMTQSNAPSKLLRKIFLQIVLYHAVAMAFLLPWGERFLELMFGREMDFGFQSILLLVTLSFFAGLCTLLYYYLLTIRRMGWQWLVMVAANGVVWSVGQILIPNRPLDGAIVALLAGAGFQLACYGLMSLGSRESTNGAAA